MDYSEINKANSEFWNELCGTTLAKSLNINDWSLESLVKFDNAYFDIYPYLLDHVPVKDFANKKVLEIGLGYGTLGQKIAENAGEYSGLDIAAQPVAMMNHRIRLQDFSGKAVQGNMLECPFESNYFDFVVSIGCFHHTGNVQRCIDEAYRVLKPGGTAIIMVYNSFSFRQWQRWPKETWRYLLSEWRLTNPQKNVTSDQIKAYDAGVDGEPAPETVFLSIKKLRQMLSSYQQVKLVKENFDDLIIFNQFIPRRRLLSNLGKIAGLDIYISAQKPLVGA